MNWGTVELEPEVLDWLKNLAVGQFAAAAFHIDLLAAQEPLLGEPHTRQLDGKLRELRFYLDGLPVRVTYWIATGGGSCCSPSSTRLGCVRSVRYSALVAP
jgi:hypothetical protein